MCVSEAGPTSLGGGGGGGGGVGGKWDIAPAIDPAPAGDTVILLKNCGF